MIGRWRLAFRYALPRPLMKRTGETDLLSRAVGESLPRGESPMPSTLIDGSTALSASYDRASSP
jgi:hypothetical protein